MKDLPSSQARQAEVEVSRLPEVAEFAKYLSLLFKELGISQRQYAERVITHESVVSRYLNGRRVATQDFLDRLIKEVDRRREMSMQPEVVAHLKKLRLQALSVADPDTFEMERLRDQIDISHREIKRLVRQQEALVDLLEKRERQAEEAEQKALEQESDWIAERLETRSTQLQLRGERDQLNDECERLREEIRILREQLAAVRDLRQTAEERCGQLERDLDAAELALAEKQANLIGDLVEVPDLDELKEEVMRARRESRMHEVAQSLVLASGWYTIHDLVDLAAWLHRAKLGVLCRILLNDAVRFRATDFLFELIKAVSEHAALGIDFARSVASSIGSLRSYDDIASLYGSMWDNRRSFRLTHEMTVTWAMSANPAAAAEVVKLARSVGDDRLSTLLLFDLGTGQADFVAGVARGLLSAYPDDALVLLTRNIATNPSSDPPGLLLGRLAVCLDPQQSDDSRLLAMAYSRIKEKQITDAFSFPPDSRAGRFRDWTDAKSAVEKKLSRLAREKNAFAKSWM